jgi:hypothetical protein
MGTLNTLNWPILLMLILVLGKLLLIWLSPAALRDAANYCLSKAAAREAHDKAYAKARKPVVARKKVIEKQVETSAAEVTTGHIVSIKSRLFAPRRMKSGEVAEAVE